MTFFWLFTYLWAENWTTEGVMTFFLLFNCLWAENGKLDICGRDDLFFCSSLYPALLA